MEYIIDNLLFGFDTFRQLLQYHVLAQLIKIPIENLLCVLYQKPTMTIFYPAAVRKQPKKQRNKI